jgi:3-phenylpropionate/cinnamic acid dioxygenase small subunit
MSELRVLVDERNITRLLYRYAHALDGRDADAWRSCFTADATFETRHGTYVGEKQINGLFDALRSAATKHLLTSPLIELDGDSATVASHFLLCVQDGEELKVDFFGRYLDRVVRGPGDAEWRFRERRIVPEAQAVRA